MNRLAPIFSGTAVTVAVVVMGAIPFVAQADVVFEHVGYDSAYGQSGNGTIDLGTHTDNVVVLQIPGNTSPSAVDVGGVAGTQVFTSCSNGGVATTDVWIAKMGSATGVKTVTVTSSNGRWRGTSFSGVDQTTPVDSHGQSCPASNASVSVSLTPSHAGSAMWSAWDGNSGGGSMSSESNITLKSPANEAGCSSPFTGCNVGDIETLSSATTQTLTWSQAIDWVMVSVMLNPSASGGGGGTASTTYSTATSTDVMALDDVVFHSVVVFIIGIIGTVWMWHYFM